jgi:hypothetical protein
MIKKIVSLGLIFLALTTMVYAYADDSVDLPAPGMTADNPLHFFEKAGEGIRSVFTFGPQKRAERFIDLSRERLAEVQELLEKEEPKKTKRTILESKKLIERAKLEVERAREKGFDVADLEREIEDVIVLQKDLFSSERVEKKPVPVEMVLAPQDGGGGKPGMNEEGSTQVTPPQNSGGSCNSKLSLCKIQCGEDIVNNCTLYSSTHMYNLLNCRGSCMEYVLFYGCGMEAGCDSSCWENYEAACGPDAYYSCIGACEVRF